MIVEGMWLDTGLAWTLPPVREYPCQPRRFLAAIQSIVVRTDHSTDRIEQKLFVEWLAEVRGCSGLFGALAR